MKEKQWRDPSKDEGVHSKTELVFLCFFLILLTAAMLLIRFHQLCLHSFIMMVLVIHHEIYKVH